ncbi:DUF3300 domain-containing protein [Pseudaminobacter arsenicus]|uniref:DUF3300 domain-containing protein n=1 Tax=Borborobacter arsenicus TaxID=1851146 RepID=A0A432V112_9HYPH|nr:DUF3300 domain-containing protein [Pseudaminobacter arsenicus]RUM95785.1 DUF3300 domain-containing protein [Pseudaminobacter arsenicus]
MSRSSAAQVVAIALVLTAAISATASAQSQPQPATAAATASPAKAPEPLSDDELEVLVARFALYPDELVALVCAASLFPLQIVEAERFLEKRAKDKTLEPKDSWDGSVISLLNYPEVVKMMSEDLDWTQALADALTNQQKDVLIAIQQLREEAVAKDIIKSDDKIKVVGSGDNIVIQPVNAETIYVPRYEPEMLYETGYAPAPISYYSEPYPSYYYPTAGFWAGAVTGAFFGAIVDWDDWGVWGGDWDGDVDIDCNGCLNNINGKVNWKDVDWKNVDRSKLKIDRDQLAKLDRTSIRNGIKADGRNSIRTKASDVRNQRASDLSRKAELGKDVRKSALADPQRRSSDLSRANVQKSKAKARSKSGTQKATRSSGKKVASRASGKPKAGARVDRRPSKPSGLGNVNRGKVAKVSSSRGRQSMGGGYRGGGHRGGGHVMRSGGRPGGGGGMRGGGGGGRRR